MRNYPVVTDAHAHVKTKAEALERIREGIPTMVCGTDPEDARWVMELCHMPETEGILFPAYGKAPSMVCGSMEGGGYDAIPGKMPGDR